jgi:hypothetical protein
MALACVMYGGRDQPSRDAGADCAVALGGAGLRLLEYPFAPAPRTPPIPPRHWAASFRSRTLFFRSDANFDSAERDFAQRSACSKRTPDKPFLPPRLGQRPPLRGGRDRSLRRSHIFLVSSNGGPPRSDESCGMAPAAAPATNARLSPNTSSWPLHLPPETQLQRAASVERGLLPMAGSGRHQSSWKLCSLRFAHRGGTGLRALAKPAPVVSFTAAHVVKNGRDGCVGDAQRRHAFSDAKNDLPVARRWDRERIASGATDPRPDVGPHMTPRRFIENGR